MIFARVSIFGIVAVVAVALGGCSQGSDVANSPRRTTTAEVKTAPQESHFQQCADIATWTNRVYEADGTASATPTVSTDFVDTAKRIQSGVRPEIEQAMHDAVQSLDGSFDVASYNSAMDELSTACADTGLKGAFTKYDIPGAASSTPAPTAEYTLSVTGSGAAQVVWTTASGSEQHSVSLPWSTTIPDDGSAYSTIVLAATTTSGADTEIGCSISEGDQVFASNKSSGAYATVSCSKS